MSELLDQRRYLIPFRTSLLPQIFTDTLVIGAGAAGLRAAITAGRTRDVIVLAKSPSAVSNTSWAQGGIAIPAGDDDSVDSHVSDTLIAGAGLCDDPAVRLIIGNAKACLDDLIRLGARFDRNERGEIALGREAAHEHSRIVHANGDATGAEIIRTLEDAARQAPRVRRFDDCYAIDLLTATDRPGSPVLGAITMHPRHGLQIIRARHTVLATGGAGAVYRETSNPRSATADGVAMAYRAGAHIADMAFIQFHPTTLYIAGAPRALISEAVRGAGALLIDQGGHRFMPDYDDRAELASRDIVSRTIVQHIASRGGTHVFLDARGIDRFSDRFPSIAAKLAEFGIDPASDLIPVNPAAHYAVGGVHTDLTGQTSVEGLYAVGEVASIGLHGANRLASNSLLESLVMGHLAGERIGSSNGAGAEAAISVPVVSDIRPSDRGELDIADVLSSLRSAMWRNVGVERTGARLDDAMDMIDFWARYTLDKIFDEPTGWQAQNSLLVASLITRSSQWRQESRGCLWRQDHPAPSDEYLVHDCWRRGSTEPKLIPVSGQRVQTPTALTPQST
ncbi:MAG: L-aspartate oxidase [Phycisphaeraceae bacterium]|nr:L-aspartate oxidase [Phycisphaeraceae bacterium]